MENVRQELKELYFNASLPLRQWTGHLIFLGLIFSALRGDIWNLKSLKLYPVKSLYKWLLLLALAVLLETYYTLILQIILFMV